ncbi:MAG: phosphoribosyl-ATP diphosphatase [Pseudomonadota bacterium]
MTSLAFLTELEAVIRQRIESPPEGSYTAELLAAGPSRIAQKLGEEGVELALASVTGDDYDVRNEAADLLYHLLVLLNARGLSLADVVTTLESRQR